MNNTILAFCVSENWCFAALKVDDRLFGLMRPITTEKTQATLLLPTIEDLWKVHGKVEPQTIISIRGPGSFTTVRLTISVAQGFAVAFPRATCYAPTLNELLGHIATQNGKNQILTLVNSRRGDFYGQLYINGVGESLQTMTLNDIEELMQKYPSLKLCGDFDLDVMHEKIKSLMGERWLAVKNNWAEGLVTLYLKKQDHLTPEEENFLPLYLYTPEYKKSTSS